MLNSTVYELHHAINVTITKTVGILAFIGMINNRLKARKAVNVQPISFYKRVKFHVQLR